MSAFANSCGHTIAADSCTAAETFTKDAFRVSYSLLTGALVVGAICGIPSFEAVFAPHICLRPMEGRFWSG
jgi:hypothetical protein